MTMTRFTQHMSLQNMVPEMNCENLRAVTPKGGWDIKGNGWMIDLCVAVGSV